MINNLRISDIHVRERYTYTPSVHAVTEEGQILLRQLLDTIYLEDQTTGVSKEWWDKHGFKFIPKLPTEWDWALVGEYVFHIPGDKKEHKVSGKLSKRIGAYYHKRYENLISLKKFHLDYTHDNGRKFKGNLLQILGEEGSRHSVANIPMVFCFDNSFDWEAGDFGDRGSCFWGGRNEARTIMENHSAWALKVYREGTATLDNGDGVGRAWVAFDEVCEDSILLFNGYGPNVWGDQTLYLGQLISQWLGTEYTYKKISLRNNGDACGTLYINNSCGILIGRKGEIEDYDEYDFHWQDDVIGTCEVSGELIFEGDDYIEVDGAYYLEGYYDSSQFRRCEHCGDIGNIDNMFSVDEWDTCYCNDCIEEVAISCGCCDEWTLEENTQYVDGEGFSVCDSCFDTQIEECPVTHLDYLLDNLISYPLVGYVSRFGADEQTGQFIQAYTTTFKIERPGRDRLVELGLAENDNGITSQTIADVIDKLSVIANEYTDNEQLTDLVASIFQRESARMGAAFAIAESMKENS
jgi:hypothetical protein